MDRIAVEHDGSGRLLELGELHAHAARRVHAVDDVVRDDGRRALAHDAAALPARGRARADGGGVVIDSVRVESGLVEEHRSPRAPVALGVAPEDVVVLDEGAGAGVQEPDALRAPTGAAAQTVVADVRVGAPHVGAGRLHQQGDRSVLGRAAAADRVVLDERAVRVVRGRADDQPQRAPVLPTAAVGGGSRDDVVAHDGRPPGDRYRRAAAPLGAPVAPGDGEPVEAGDAGDRIVGQDPLGVRVHDG